MKIFNKKKEVQFDQKNEVYNVVESISKSKNLFLELIKLCHPDNNPGKEDIATELSQDLMQNRFNYRKLVEIQNTINEKLK
jgi:hypothetical protein